MAMSYFEKMIASMMQCIEQTDEASQRELLRALIDYKTANPEGYRSLRRTIAMRKLLDAMEEALDISLGLADEIEAET